MPDHAIDAPDPFTDCDEVEIYYGQLPRRALELRCGQLVRAPAADPEWRIGIGPARSQDGGERPSCVRLELADRDPVDLTPSSAVLLAAALARRTWEIIP
jgi:hypothetical protein